VEKSPKKDNSKNLMRLESSPDKTKLFAKIFSKENSPQKHNKRPEKKEPRVKLKQATLFFRKVPAKDDVFNFPVMEKQCPVMIDNNETYCEALEKIVEPSKLNEQVKENEEMTPDIFDKFQSESLDGLNDCDNIPPTPPKKAEIKKEKQSPVASGSKINKQIICMDSPEIFSCVDKCDSDVVYVEPSHDIYSIPDSVCPSPFKTPPMSPYMLNVDTQPNEMQKKLSIVLTQRKKIGNECEDCAYVSKLILNLFDKFYLKT
jgi:hypothetical protein